MRTLPSPRPLLCSALIAGLLTAAAPATAAGSMVGIRAAVPMQAQVPSGWAQTRLPGPAAVVSVVAPGTPPPAALILFAAPLGHQASAKELRDFISGSESSAQGGGAMTLKQTGESPRTVNGLRGIERRYVMVYKKGGARINSRVWYGAGPTNLYQLQLSAGPGATAAQLASYDVLLKTMHFGPR
jgi:hypothetical protein